MRHLTPTDYRIMPWRNGGGTTTEIAIFPEDAGISADPFIWRLSIADVASDGPFSRFPGYDRHIMTIAGAGMRLDAGAHGEIDLSVPFVPQRFSGDWDVFGRLMAGPVRDFNLMTARDKVSASLDVQRLDDPTHFSSAGATMIIHMLEGEALFGGHLLVADETLIIDRQDAIELAPLGDAATIAVAAVRFLAPVS